MMTVRHGWAVQVSNLAYIRKGDYFEKISNPKKITIKGFDTLDLVAHKVSKGKIEFWTITEGISGARVSKMNKSLKRCMSNLDNVFQMIGEGAVIQKIRELVGDKFLSPRYRFVVNPNKIYYVATERDNNSKSIFTPRYKVQVRNE